MESWNGRTSNGSELRTWYVVVETRTHKVLYEGLSFSAAVSQCHGDCCFFTLQCETLRRAVAEALFVVDKIHPFQKPKPNIRKKNGAYDELHSV